MAKKFGPSALDGLLNELQRLFLWAYHWSDGQPKCLVELYNTALQELRRRHGDTPTLTALKPYVSRVRKRFDSFDELVAEDLAAQYYSDFAPYLARIREGNYSGLSVRHRRVLAGAVQRRLAWFLADWLFVEEQRARARW